MARTQSLPERVTLLGIRHHGPGSARMVRAALEALSPKVILIEGPPEGDALLAHVPELTPPVALLLHDEADPASASFWPFARFSPEWQALSWGAEQGAAVRFFDLPAAMSLARAVNPPAEPVERKVLVDPLAVLAEAAGFDDPERWWEDVVEHSAADPLGLAEAVAEAMGALREEFADTVDEHTLRREAAMRQNLRKALKDTDGPIAVVCGAWHVPALRQLPAATGDAALLRGQPRLKVAGSWVPWSHGRLAATSGYGAGVDSPGWYAHLWERAPAGDVLPRWLARTAQVLRDQGLPASTASAVEAVRLAETLAAIRGRPSAGLTEVTEATLAVLCGGDDTGLKLVRERLVVGEELGAVGDKVPRSPLAADVARLQRRLRLHPEAAERNLRLDLRKDIDRERSKLLRRLRVLEVHWGEPEETGGLGTFTEGWTLRWDPGLAVALAAAARHGTTVEAAATQVLVTESARLSSVAEAAQVLDVAVGAELPSAVLAARAGLDRCAAAATDAIELLTALPALARTVRYGSVRDTDPELLRTALHGLLARGAVGLPMACLNIDEETAGHALSIVDGAHEAVRLAADEEHAAAWWEALRRLVELGARDPAKAGHGLPTGRACRLLWESGRLDTEAVAARLHRAVSLRGAPGAAAAFVAGFLHGSAALLAADTRLLGLVDGWLSGLDGEAFADALPLLRRAVGTFSGPERRTLAERIAAGAGRTAVADTDWDPGLAERLTGFVRELYRRAGTR
ncbi:MULTISPECIES: DUF5682 family protein [unclassified Crossiella]|uniref:DUF5682 family protein n=1 Tax=unclassified Crossiella TaxID=2620835 RepID=UPI001FFF07B4|nr:MULTISPECIES: DUF5682 family protein [unclassified Crossiella]MCK2236349.1 DUF5682 family protein [Crossiella sp. S99.2]MCK2250016.1 DUF5682 family protein [Crossiella sp. S99.1]